jgi:hypothetical protein
LDAYVAPVSFDSLGILSKEVFFRYWLEQDLDEEEALLRCLRTGAQCAKYHSTCVVRFNHTRQ